ncbi:hypothetical protein Tco_0004630 [Tanacetum coccineum]
MASTRASISKVSKRPKINIIPPKQLFVDLTQDDTKTPSPKLPNSSPSAPNAPSKTPSTKDTSSSSIDYIPKSPTSSTSPSPNGYLNPSTSPPPRVSPPPPTQDNASMDITLTLSPNTPLDVQFDTPSPSPPIIAHPIPWNFLEAHGFHNWYQSLVALDLGFIRIIHESKTFNNVFYALKEDLIYATEFKIQEMDSTVSKLDLNNLSLKRFNDSLELHSWYKRLVAHDLGSTRCFGVASMMEKRVNLSSYYCSIKSSYYCLGLKDTTAGCVPYWITHTWFGSQIEKDASFKGKLTEEVFDDEEMTQVKVLMDLADDELDVGNNHAYNGE